MVNLVPGIISAAGYTLCAFLINHFVSVPENLKKKEEKDYKGQWLSIIHAYCAIIGCSVVYFLEGGIDYSAETNEYHEWVILNSIGYFIFDSIYAEYFHLHENLMRVHHVFGLLSLFTMLYSPIGGPAFMLGIWMAEISNPCILKRHQLRARNMESSFIYNFYENAFIFLFLTVRIIGGFWYLIKVWDSKINIFYAMMASSIYTISWFWVFIIISKSLKAFNGTTNPVMARVLSLIRFLKGNKALLLVIFAFFGYGIPYILTQYLDLQFGQFEIEGFKRVDNLIMDQRPESKPQKHSFLWMLVYWFYFSSFARILYVFALLSSLSIVILEFLIDFSVLTLRTFVIAKLSVLALLAAEALMRISLQGVKNYCTLLNCFDVVFSCLCSVGFILSLQTKVLKTLGNETCNTLFFLRNSCFLCKITLIYLEKKENLLISLKVSLNIEEEELTNLKNDENKRKKQFHEEFTEEEVKKQKTTWGIIKGASD